MKRVRSIAILFIMIFLVPFAAYSAPVGKITAVKGQVEITSSGQKARPASLGDEILALDIISTGSRSRAELTFLDSNIVRMAQSSRLEVTEYLLRLGGTRGLFKLFTGKIQNVLKLAIGRSFGPKKRNRYEVHTPTAVIGVRGTDFFTYHINGVTGSTFKKGFGYTYSVNRPDVVINISAGQSMVVTSPDIPPVVRPATDLEIQAHEKDTVPSPDALEAPADDLEKIPDEDLMLEKEIEDEMRNLDRIDQELEIPQPIPRPHTDHDYSH